MIHKARARAFTPELLAELRRRLDQLGKDLSELSDIYTVLNDRANEQGHEDAFRAQLNAVEDLCDTARLLSLNHNISARLVERK